MAAKESSRTFSFTCCFLALAISQATTTVKPEDCTKPPYCHQWWLSGDGTVSTVSLVFSVVLASVFIILLILVICLALMVAGRHCFSAMGECCGPGEYQPVKQEDQDIEVDALRDPNHRRPPSSRFSLLLACCCGVVLTMCVIGAGGVFWWRLSGSPPLAGLPHIANSKSKGHSSGGHGHQGGTSRKQHKDNHLSGHGNDS